MNQSIHPDTSLGTVSLKVRQLSLSVDYYVNNLGFQVNHNKVNQTSLGAGKGDLLILNEVEGAIHYPRST